MNYKKLAIFGTVGICVGTAAYFVYRKVRRDYPEFKETFLSKKENAKSEKPDNVSYIRVVTDSEMAQEKSSLNGYEMKPAIDTVAYDGIAREYGSSALESDRTDIQEAPKESDAHICTADEYIEGYPYYSKHTLTWYSEEKRLVDLDDGFEVIMNHKEAIGSACADLLDKEEWDGDALYSVNHDKSICYEIVRETESTYIEDLADYNRNSETN